MKAEDDVARQLQETQARLARLQEANAQLNRQMVEHREGNARREEARKETVRAAAAARAAEKKEMARARDLSFSSNKSDVSVSSLVDGDVNAEHPALRCTMQRWWVGALTSRTRSSHAPAAAERQWAVSLDQSQFVAIALKVRKALVASWDAHAALPWRYMSSLFS